MAADNKNVEKPSRPIKDSDEVVMRTLVLAPNEPAPPTQVLVGGKVIMYRIIRKEKAPSPNVVPSDKSTPPERDCRFCHGEYGSLADGKGHHMNNCPAIICRRCGTKGHTDRVCTVPECATCGRMGHETVQCYRNSTCERCGYQGHIADKCHTPMCDHCGKIGHKIDRCYALTKCTKCLRTGHDAAACYSEPWCDTCRAEHHPGICPKYSCRSCGAKDHLERRCDSPYVLHRR